MEALYESRPVPVDAVGRHAADRHRSRHAARVIGFALDRRALGRGRSAPTPTTSRSAPAACCCRWPRRSGRGSAYVAGVQRHRRRGRPRRRQPRPRSCPAADADVRSARPRPTAACPAHWDEVKELVQAVRRRRSARPRPRPVARRRPPGPPLARRARHDRRSAIRSSCTTRSPSGTATSARPNVYVPLADDVAHRKVELLNELLPVAERPRLVGRRGVPRPDAAARHGVPSPLRRGVHQPQGRRRPRLSRVVRRPGARRRRRARAALDCDLVAVRRVGDDDRLRLQRRERLRRRRRGAR